MRREPMTQREVYEVLKKLAPKMQELKDTNSTNLTADEVQSMKDVYPDVQVLAGGSMALQFNATCATCVKDALIIYSSLHDRLERAFDVTDNPDKYIAPEDEVAKYQDQLPEQLDPEKVAAVNLSESPAVVEPVAEEPQAPAPVVTEETPAPIVEAPAIEQPVTEAPAPVAESPAVVEEVVLTPAQKAAATKAANKAKKEAE